MGVDLSQARPMADRVGGLGQPVVVVELVPSEAPRNLPLAPLDTGSFSVLAAGDDRGWRGTPSRRTAAPFVLSAEATSGRRSDAPGSDPGASRSGPFGQGYRNQP